jgi:hypothetical protein
MICLRRSIKAELIGVVHADVIRGSMPLYELIKLPELRELICELGQLNNHAAMDQPAKGAEIDRDDQPERNLE